MRNRILPFLKRRWSASWPLILAAYLARFLEITGLMSLRWFGVTSLPDYTKLPWFIVGAVTFVSYAIVKTSLSSTARAQLLRVLSCKDFPKGFSALAMIWPKRVQEDVWEPAFNDAYALYLELRETSYLPILNLFFGLKMTYWIVVTGRIALIDWSMSRLTSKRSRLSQSFRKRKYD